MGSSRSEIVEELFHMAAACDPAVRMEYLDRVCANNPAVRREIESLLEADSGAGDFLVRPAYGPDYGRAAGGLLGRGRRIGAYEIVRPIATGGMGAVYEAVQERPRRTVALKIMRTSMAGEAAMRRFRYEAELLGRLRHSGIAQIYDAGTHEDDGQRVPYFVMEFVPQALSLPEYAETRRLNTRRRLELFAEVCDAVQHGHERGVVHRDLKPGNLLVGADGRPKVIDFGVARATHFEAPLTTVQTTVGQLVGTLAYMSPEQAGGDPDAVDVRSDVYSLGVVLYELLAGRRLFDLTSKPLLDAVRAISEGDPAPLGKVDRAFRGDLETIVEKALAREKDRRYASAGSLAEDIRRHLRDEPLLARPPSAAYQFRKFARRNRALVAGASVAMLGLMLGSSLAAWKAIDATRQRDAAEREARKAERVASFLRSVLSAGDPRKADADVTIRAALERALDQADSELANEPEVLASVDSLVGGIFVRMHQPERAERHLRRALSLRRKLYGDGAECVADAMTDLAWALPIERCAESEDLFAGALQIRREHHGDDHVSTALAAVHLASVITYRGEYEAAAELCRRSLPILRREQGTELENVAFALTTLASCLTHARDLPAAERAYREAADIKRRVLGPDHIELASTLSNLAGVLRQAGREAEADACTAEAARIRVKRLGPDAADACTGDDPAGKPQGPP